MAGLVLVERLRVAYAAPRTGSGPLTFGQQDTLLRLTDDQNQTVAVRLPLPAGTLLADIAPALGILLARHEALRTRFVRGVQVVDGPGVLVVDVLRIEPAVDDVEPLLVDHLTAGGIDIEAGPPLRVGIAMRDEVPTAATLVCSPVAADSGGLAVLARQFTELVTASVIGYPVTDPGPRGHQPLDQAEVELTADSASAVRFWTEQLRTAPQQLPPAAVAFSQAARRALTGIAERTGAEWQVVLIAAVCTVLSVRTGEDRFLFPWSCRNRDRLPDYVGALAQNGPLVFDVAGETFDDVVCRVAAAREVAEAYARYDSVALRAATERIAHERGVAFRRDVPLGAPVSEGMERLLAAAAAGPVPLSDLTWVEPVVRGPGWVLVDSCWVQLPRVCVLVTEALRVPAAFVTATPDGLVAYLPTSARARTPAQAHAACMAELADRPDTMAPGHYVLCAGVPDDPTDEAAWSALPVVAEGSGRSSIER